MTNKQIKQLEHRDNLIWFARTLGLSVTTESGVLSGVYIQVADNTYEFAKTEERIKELSNERV